MTEPVPDRECEYPSLVEPPVGYVMLANQVLDLKEIPEIEDLPDDVILFRGKVQRPDGTQKYFSCMLHSVAPLCRIAFWQDIWDEIAAADCWD